MLDYRGGKWEPPHLAGGNPYLSLALGSSLRQMRFGKKVTTQQCARREMTALYSQTSWSPPREFFFEVCVRIIYSVYMERSYKNLLFFFFFS